MQSANAGVDTGEQAEILSGEPVSQAFAHILSGGLRPLYGGAYRVLGNAADAEDAVQDGLLAAYMHLDQFRGHSKMSTWLAASCTTLPGWSCAGGCTISTFLSTSQSEKLRSSQFRSD